MTAAIEIRGVSKRFRLYHEKYTSVKERVIHFGRIPFDDFWALKDIEFDVEEATTFGLLGHNGSGKSTLLKCICGILQPTAGEIRTRGRVAALLELGAGFHPDLSGRDNVYLNASLLGMSRRDIEAKFDEIVGFAELEPFIDNQVKYYSSGMYVRLGFAVAVNMDPEILIVDEVLAVGDELFQRKCIDRVKQFQREGRTIVVVTHSPDMVRQICNMAGVLDQGHLVSLSEPGEAVREFREHLLRRQAYVEAEQLGVPITVVGDQEPRVEPSPQPDADAASEDDSGDASTPAKHSRRSTDLRITSVRFTHPESDSRAYLLPGEPLTVRIGYHAKTNIDDVVPGISVYDLQGNMLFGANSQWFPTDITLAEGTGEIVFDFPSVPLLDGTYPVTVGLTTSDEATVYDWHEQHYQFAVMNPTRAGGLLYLPAKVSVAGTPPAEEQLQHSLATKAPGDAESP
jgi:ABC-2 type transport system ATP-binding protein